MKKVAIIDSGGANIASLEYAFSRLGVSAELTSNAATIRASSHVVLPGVGAAENAMRRLTDAGLVDVIRGLRQPVLGICLGMQLLCEGSEEADVECLGIVPGVAVKLPAGSGFPVPNMGWCRTEIASEHALLNGIDSGDFFYYLHSYALPVSDRTVASAGHAIPFSAVISHDNFTATQFHPERSSLAGARLLGNFVGLQTCA